MVIVQDPVGGNARGATPTAGENIKSDDIACHAISLSAASRSATPGRPCAVAGQNFPGRRPCAIQLFRTCQAR